MKNVLAGLFMALAISACTTSGPYVTNITSDGENGLNIQKCGIRFNGLTGALSTTNCTNEHVTLSRAEDENE